MKTIREDAEEYYVNNIFCDGITEFEHDIAIRCYIAGAKNQVEKMYSEEEVIEIAKQYAKRCQATIQSTQWLTEQFKNKGHEQNGTN